MVDNELTNTAKHFISAILFKAQRLAPRGRFKTSLSALINNYDIQRALMIESDM